MNIGSINNSAASVSSAATMKSQADKVENFQSVLENAASSGDDKELRKACEEFESYFIQVMFKEMRKTVMSSEGVLPKSQAEQMFQDMLDEENAKSAARGNGIGLANMMYKQMARKTVSPEELESIQ